MWSLKLAFKTHSDFFIKGFFIMWERYSTQEAVIYSDIVLVPWYLEKMTKSIKIWKFLLSLNFPNFLFLFLLIIFLHIISLFFFFSWPHCYLYSWSFFFVVTFVNLSCSCTSCFFLPTHCISKGYLYALAAHSLDSTIWTCEQWAELSIRPGQA